jgi:hypothetical protein
VIRDGDTVHAKPQSTRIDDGQFAGTKELPAIVGNGRRSGRH